MLNSNDNNGLLADLAGKLKASSFFGSSTKKDRYAEEFYYFNEADEGERKKIKIDLRPDLTGIEKLKYYGFGITKKTYIFKTTDPYTGIIKTGLIKAQDEKDVETEIENIYKVKGYGYEPYIGHTFFEKISNDPLYFMGSVTKKEVYQFTKRFSDLIRSGVELKRALETIRDNIRNAKFKMVLSDLIEVTSGGEMLSTALSKYPHLFDNFYVSMIDMAEKNGKLSDSLKEIANQLKKEISLAGRIKSALIMPGVIMTAVMGMTYFMFTFLIPVLATLYADIGTELPGATKLAIDISNNLKENGIFYLLGLMTIPFAYTIAAKVPLIREYIDAAKMHMPIFGKLVRWGEQIQFLRILAPMMEANSVVDDTLKITWKASNNIIYRKAISQIANNSKNGKEIHISMKQNLETLDEALWDQDLVVAVQTAYETAKISTILLQSAEVLEEQMIEYQENIEKLLSPFILLIIVVIVGFILYAAFAPIYSGGMLKSGV